jgi:hypothetical protein
MRLADSVAHSIEPLLELLVVPSPRAIADQVEHEASQRSARARLLEVARLLRAPQWQARHVQDLVLTVQSHGRR